MSLINENTVEHNGVKIHSISTEKFKTNTIVLRLSAPLNKEDVTLRALLPHVLQRAAADFPSTTELRRYLDELYGATLHVDLSKKGEKHIITFRMEIANEHYLKDSEPLLEKGMQLLSQILLKPLVENGRFSETIVNQEKRTLKQRIQAVYDDKMRYSNLRLVQEMFKNEPYALHVNGEVDAIDQITPQSLYEYYSRILKEDKIDLYIVGDVKDEEAAEYAKKYFFIHDHMSSKSMAEKKTVSAGEVNEVIEKQDVKQGKLNMGFRTNIVYSDSDYYALQVLNGIYGGFSHSKLFINIREKESLAYYAASRVESHKGVLMVMSGIEEANYDKALTIIKKQMEEIKNGNVSDQELSQTKAVINNQLLETIDTSYGMIEVLYHNEISGTDRTFDEWMNGISSVTRDEVIDAAKKIELDTIYFLKGDAQ
ncbi:insulinase family protein [Bacillus lacus]|uniref:Insulinase family protein n=1 Tax=Metabacillus lacus TaxID=1983721 RepID=A0A7X2IW13_9BACI|nr:pitrilysin family protein [Metabacillus lacus]MRX70659.1 insulinase family protein [Metabacillus lacus]